MSGPNGDISSAQRPDSADLTTGLPSIISGRGGNKVAPDSLSMALEEPPKRHPKPRRRNSFDSSRQSSSASLYERKSNMMVDTETDDVSDKFSIFKKIYKTKETLGVIFILLVITFLCSYFKVLRLPTCAVQTLLIGFASLKWEEDSWIGTKPNRVLRIVAQIFLTMVPFSIGLLLVFLCGAFLSGVLIPGAILSGVLIPGAFLEHCAEQGPFILTSRGI